MSPPSIIRDEHGFSVIEALVAAVVVVSGLLALLTTLIVAAHATGANRQREAATSLARELVEDARTVSYAQLVQSSLVSALQPLVPGSTVSGSNLAVVRSVYRFTVSMTECSLDDPADGYGDHSSPPTSGGSWCPDVAASGTTDSAPDDYKRFAVTVTPSSGSTTSQVRETVLVYNRPQNGPAVTCLSTSSSCPGTNQTITSGSSLTFNVTTTTTPAEIQWLVNGNPPPSGQLPTGADDPYVPSGSTSSFTWDFPTADGTYTISATAFDGNGNKGTRQVLQITLNRHQVIAPTSINAGWNAQIQGVDIQWVPSVDQDVVSYKVYHQVGSNSVEVACSSVTGTSCTDPSADAPPTAPTCTNPPQSYTTSNTYWVVGIDTNPLNGQTRESTAQSPKVDANLCDHPPNAPTGLSATFSGGTATLAWTAPSPADPDLGDSIQGWRIYRWPAGQSVRFPGSRYDVVGALDSSGNQVTSYTDNAADPAGVTQDYCVTAVDQRMNESPCSNVIAG